MNSKYLIIEPIHYDDCKNHWHEWGWNDIGFRNNKLKAQAFILSGL